MPTSTACVVPMNIYSRRIAQLSQDQLPVFRVHADGRVFTACVVVGTCEGFPEDLDEADREAVRRMIDADGSIADWRGVWCLEVERPADAMQQVADAALCVHPNSKVAFLCVDKATVAEVVRALERS